MGGSGEQKMTILDAAVAVLADKKPRTSKEIHDEIVRRSLFDFRAQDPIAMVRAAIRKHLRNTAEKQQRVRKVGKDLWGLS